MNRMFGYLNATPRLEGKKFQKTSLRIEMFYLEILIVNDVLRYMTIENVRIFTCP